jgi:protoporphyrinogen/coproporphyrinogen III oxidase
MPTQIQTLVIGAGISGLATAYALQKAGVSTLILDSAARPGGLLQSVKRDGYLIECGPQSFSGTAHTDVLCETLGLSDERVFANPKAQRYVMMNGALKSVPMGPLILASPFFSGGTRTALVRDILGSTHPPEPDESIATFVRRKFSATLLDRLAGPFVSGIYAGDPEALSLRAAFPTVHEAEKQTGSVIRGMIKQRKERRETSGTGQKVKPKLQSFQDGNERLVSALVEDLGERLICRADVTSLVALDPSPEPFAPRFQVSAKTPKGIENFEAERLVLAVPANAAGKLLASVGAEFQTHLGSLEYAGVGVVSLGYHKKQIADPLNGFGFLVPRSSGLSVLGTVWNSSLFPDRAPEAHALLTNFLGGATNPAVIHQPATELAALVHREISPILGIRQEPLFTNVTIWPRGIPQYNLGHCARIAAIESARAKFPGLFITGNYLSGPSIGTCVERALHIANEIRISFAN